MNPILMIILAIALTAALVWLVIGLFDLVTHDGYGARPAPRSHPDEPTPFDRAA